MGIKEAILAKVEVELEIIVQKEFNAALDKVKIALQDKVENATVDMVIEALFAIVKPELKKVVLGMVEQISEEV